MSMPWDPEAADALRFVTPGLADAEVAAVTAVVSSAVHEEARADRLHSEQQPSRWARSSAVRAPLPAAWRSFG